MRITPSVFWPAVIAGALGLHVLVMAAMVYIATSNDSYAVEPDYYAKALAWDEQRAQEQRNDELGWRLELVVEPAAPGADPTLRATLVDAAGESLSDATVTVEAFSNTHRNDILTAVLGATPGGFAATLPMRGSGRWEFRFTVTRDQDVFTYRETRHVYTELSQ